MDNPESSSVEGDTYSKITLWKILLRGKIQNENLPTEQAGLEAFALDLYSKGARFESRREGIILYVHLGMFEISYRYEEF